MPDFLRPLRAGLIVSAAFLFCFAGKAFATTYCVGTAPNCTGTAEPDFQTALTKADADTQDTDTIVLPAGTLSYVNGFVYHGAVPLEVDGQGSDSTTLTLPTNANSEYVLTLQSGDKVTLSGLSVAIPPDSTDDYGIYSTVPTAISNAAVTSSGATQCARRNKSPRRWNRQRCQRIVAGGSGQHHSSAG